MMKFRKLTFSLLIVLMFVAISAVSYGKDIDPWAGYTAPVQRKVLAKETVAQNASVKEWKWKRVGGDKYSGTNEEAVMLLGFPEEVRPLLLKKVYARIYKRAKISKGDFIPKMLFGKNTIKESVRADWSNRSKPMLAKVYIVEYGGEKYVLVWASTCGNWSRYFVGKKSPTRPTISPDGRKKVPTDLRDTNEEVPDVNEFLGLSYAGVGGGSVPVVIEEAPNPEKLGGEKVTSWFFGTGEPSNDGRWEHNPDVGLWYGRNKVAHFGGIWGDYMAWRKNFGSIVFGDKTYSYDLGIGAVASYSPGEILDTDYSWKEYLVGIQMGAQTSYADSETGYLRQIQAKIKLGYEWQRGSSSAYWVEQENWKIGWYAEYLRQFQPRWLSITSVDGWWDIATPHFESSWAGDSPQNRFQFGIGQYFQYQINRDWAVKAGAGWRYQGWDEIYGISALAELRWRNTIMFGPALFYPLTTGIYDVYSISDLTTWYGFIRAELGWSMRKWLETKNAERVFQVPPEEG